MLSKAAGSRFAALRTGPRALASVLVIAWFVLLFIFRNVSTGDDLSFPFPNSLATALVLLDPRHRWPLPWWGAMVIALADACACVAVLAYLARGSLPKRLAITAAAYILASAICWAATTWVFVGQLLHVLAIMGPHGRH